MNTLSLFLSLAGCAACALLPYRQTSSLSERHKTLAFLLLLSACFIAAGSIAEWGLVAQTTDAETAKRLFSNLKHFIAIPLIGSVLLAASFNRFWTTAIWGRWVLALFALFELMRRTDLGQNYALWLGAAVMSALLISFARNNAHNIRIPGLAAAILIGISTSILDSTSLAPALQNHFASEVILSIGLALVGLASARLIAQLQKNEL